MIAKVKLILDQYSDRSVNMGSDLIMGELCIDIGSQHTFTFSTDYVFLQGQFPLGSIVHLLQSHSELMDHFLT